MSHINQAKAILKREFNKHSGIPAQTVEFTEDEQIQIWNGYEVFTMQIGSDDDQVCFIGETTKTEIIFDFPNDWPV